MPKSRRCCIFLLVLGGLHLVTGNVSISGCSGKSATLYRGISFNSDNIVFYLYKNGDNNTLLAMLSKQMSDPVNEIYQNGYGKKLSLENGTIRIHNLSKSDEGKYVIQPALGTWSIKIEVHLVVLVAPPKQCTPKIKYVENTLVASLDNEDCGNPAAHVSWHKIWASNISSPVPESNNIWEQKGNTISKIVVGKEEDAYCACTESSAMHCDGPYGRFDFCSCFKIKKDNIVATLPKQPEMTTWFESSDLTKTTTDIHAEFLKLHEFMKGILSLLIILILAFVAVTITAFILYRKEPSPTTQKKQSKDDSKLMTTKIGRKETSTSTNPEESDQRGKLITTIDEVQHVEYTRQGSRTQRHDSLDDI